MVSESAAALTEMNGLTLSCTCFGILLSVSTQFNRENSHSFAEASNWSSGTRNPERNLITSAWNFFFARKKPLELIIGLHDIPSLTHRTLEFVLFVFPGTTNTASHLQDNAHGADSSETIKLMMTHTQFWWLVFSLEFVYVSCDDDKYIRVEKRLV